MENVQYRSSRPCAACKLLRKKCDRERCFLAPYFPSDAPEKFEAIHKVYGAANFTRLIKDLPENQREDAAKSWIYEASMRVTDPVYGCTGIIYNLQQKIYELQNQLHLSKTQLLLLQPLVSNTELFPPEEKVNMLLPQSCVSNTELFPAEDESLIWNSLWD